MLQGTTSSPARASQALPPFSADLWMARARLFVPPPQASEQDDQDAQAAQTQSATSCSLIVHVSTSMTGPAHPAPKLVAGFNTVRARDLAPFPMVAEHVDQAAHSLSTQSSCWLSQGPSLQEPISFSVICGQPPPWEFGVVNVRSRKVWPPKQDLLHADQSLQALTSQSTGSGPLQGSVCISSLSHGSPSPKGVTSTSRRRTRWP
mmetsp:Transcript_127193/g.368258  ORF Transcript_127193/g.368258 Transcript_127193/m.368258 type:complete len:205 (-) Transcript_127193:1005-1619(-)